MRSKKSYMTVATWMLLLLAIVPWLHYGRRALICDSFVVKGHSMDPTLRQGEKVWVNKMILGPRIYTKFRFDTDTLSSFRLPGIRKLRAGDIALFNYPRGWTENKIGFKINYVYAKRCVGVPGDSVSITKSRYHNSRVNDVGIPEENEIILSCTDDSVLVRNRVFHAGQFAGKSGIWTIKDFGPVLVPGAGTSVMLSGDRLLVYKDVVEYETGRNIYDLEGKEYVFRENYYFFAGDNVLDSKDSRYFGFVPEEFVIGVISNGMCMTNNHRHVNED